MSIAMHTGCVLTTLYLIQMQYMTTTHLGINTQMKEVVMDKFHPTVDWAHFCATVLLVKANKVDQLYLAFTHRGLRGLLR